METNQVQQISNEEIEIDLKELFLILWRKIWLILLAGILCAGISGAITKTMITPMYQSSSMLYILSQSTSITSLADVQLGSQLTNDYAILIKSRPVVDEVIENLGLDMTYESFLGVLSIENYSDTRIIRMTITHDDPKMAKEIADEIAEVSAKQLADIMKTEEPSIIGEGQIAQSHSSPSLKKNCAIAGIAGIAVVCIILILIYLLDDNIKNSEDVERYLGLTTLGMIPMEESEKHQKKRRKSKRKERKRKVS